MEILFIAHAYIEDDGEYSREGIYCLYSTNEFERFNYHEYPIIDSYGVVYLSTYTYLTKQFSKTFMNKYYNRQFAEASIFNKYDHEGRPYWL